jgi:cell division protein FtsX
MVPSNVGYSLREAGRHFRRNWSTVLGAIVTIFLSLFVIGLFVIGSVMLSRLVGNVEDRVTIQAFVADSAKKESVDALQQKIRGWNDVESVDYKSKEQALNEYRETMSNRNAADAVAALDGENPVPASLVINLSNPKSVESVANQLIADSLDRPVVTGPVEGAAIGNLLTQAMALGDIKDLDHLRQVVRNSESVEYWHPNHSDAWETAYQKLLTFLN